jgi:hypothetical protein
MQKICIFIDHDIMVRHFILNGVLKPLHERFEVHYVFPRYKRVTYDVESLGLPNLHRLKVQKENRRLNKYDALHQIEWLRKIRSFPKGFRDDYLSMWKSTVKEEVYRKRLRQAEWPRYPFAKWMLRAGIGDDRYLLDFLRELRPCAILHPTVLKGLYVNDLIRYGQRLGIPTIYIMNSWDNPSTKSTALGFPNRLAVWGEQTRNHAVQFMGMDPRRVRCIGAAQLEVFKSPPRTSAEEYRARLGIRPDERLIAYAGCSKGVNETAHLKLLDDAITAGKLGNVRILYRPHPWRAFPKNETYFYDVEWRHVIMDPTIAECFRALRAGRERPIELADYQETHVVLNAIDALISPLSTILLEAILHGKPVMCLLPAEDLSENTWMSTNTRFPHFVEFFERVEMVMCRAQSGLVESTAQLLSMTCDPGLPERLHKSTAFFVEPSDQPYFERVRTLLLEVGV